jgi:hypothetical protein
MTVVEQRPITKAVLKGACLRLLMRGSEFPARASTSLGDCSEPSFLGLPHQAGNRPHAARCSRLMLVGHPSDFAAETADGRGPGSVVTETAGLLSTDAVAPRIGASMAWVKTPPVFWRSPHRSPRISPYWSAGLRPKDFRDETVRSALGRVHGGSDLYPFTSPLLHRPKSCANPCGPGRNGLRLWVRPAQPKAWLRSSETSTNVSTSWCAMQGVWPIDLHRDRRAEPSGGTSSLPVPPPRAFLP